MDDTLPTLLNDLARTLEVELQEDPAATAEIDDAVKTAFFAKAAPRRAQGAAPAAQRAPAAAPAAIPPTQEPPPIPVPESGDTLEAIAGEIGVCSRCSLAATRTNVVPGVGNAAGPDVMFIGEAPGADEDAQGLPFVGRAGQLLTKMIEAMGYTRDQVFIANILKCRPPGNRTPTPQEMEVCIPFLLRQVRIVRPKTIVALGATAVKGLLRTNQGINSLRGRWHDFNGIPLMPTFHPAYLLRMPVAKRDAWADLKLVLARLGRTPPQRG